MQTAVVELEKVASPTRTHLASRKFGSSAQSLTCLWSPKKIKNVPPFHAYTFTQISAHGPATPTANRFVTQNNDEQDDVFNGHGFAETRFNDMVTFSMGGSVTTIDSALSGSRIYGPGYGSSFSTTYPNSQARDSGFTGLTGGGITDDYVANTSLMVTPMTNLVVVPSLRVEYAYLLMARAAGIELTPFELIGEGERPPDGFCFAPGEGARPLDGFCFDPGEVARLPDGFCRHATVPRGY